MSSAISSRLLSRGAFRGVSRCDASRFAVRAFSTKANAWKVDNPYTGEIYTEVPTLDDSSALRLISESDKAFSSWKSTSLSERIQLVNRWCDEIAKRKESIANDITQQMGKPLKQALGEVDTCIARAKALIALAPQELADESISLPQAQTNGITKKVTKEPIGVSLVLAPWNYPLLCAVNATVAAILSGCSVLLKHSDRTPLCANHFADAFSAIGAPKGLVTAFHADHPLVHRMIAHPSIQYVSFTGSVAGGRAVYQSVAQTRFIDVGLELGGKDPAYVASDANLKYAIENVVDGGMYNAGQSCCAVERVYVHRSLYQDFLKGVVKEVSNYKLGNPLSGETNMGPLAQPRQSAFIANQVNQALSMGAKLLAGGHAIKDQQGKGRFFEPTILADCTHDMSVMVDETFGPVLAIAAVENDDEAVKKMNDSPYGLTASVWTEDSGRADTVAKQLNAGTVYQNRCDFLDPYLPWSGRKDSGKGYSLSHYAFLPFFRTKGWNLRPKTQ